MAPEVAASSGHGLPSDVWAVGALLYTFLVGRPPFHADGPYERTLARVVDGAYAIPNDVTLSAEATDLISRLLQRNPADRPSLEQLLEHPFLAAAMAEAHEDVPLEDTATTTTTAAATAPTTAATTATTTVAARLVRATGAAPLLPEASDPEATHRPKTPPRQPGGRHRGSPDSPPEASPQPVPGTTVARASKQRRPLERFTSARLPPQSHTTRHGSVYILPNSGEVCLDVSRLGELLFFSADGGEVRAADRVAAEPIQAWPLDAVPSRYHKYHRYVANIVAAIRSKTVKVTLHTLLGKAMLMEDGACDVLFGSGTRVAISADGESVRIRGASQAGGGTAFGETVSEAAAAAAVVSRALVPHLQPQVRDLVVAACEYHSTVRLNGLMFSFVY